jgi:hypothetical protein
VFRWRLRTGSDPPAQPTCPVCAEPVFESEEVRRPLLRPRTPAAPAVRTCAACGKDLGDLFARLRRVRRLRQALKGLWRTLLGTVTALVVSMVATLVILIVQDRPFALEHRWYDTALDVLQDLLQLLLVVGVLLKIAVELLDRHIDSVAAE